MPAKSKSQQRLMGMIHAYKEGELDTKHMPKSLVNKIKGIADGTRKKTGDKRRKTKGISNAKSEDFARTKHKGLPEKVKEHFITKFDDFINEGLKDFMKTYYLIEYQVINYFTTSDRKLNKSNSKISDKHQYFIKSNNEKKAEEEFKKLWHDEAAGLEPRPELKILYVLDIQDDIKRREVKSFDNEIKLY